MPHVKIDLPDHKDRLVGHAHIYVDGHELTEVRSIDVRINHQSVATVTVEVYPRSEGTIIEGEMLLNVMPMVLPGYMLREEWETPTRRVYTCWKL